MKKSQEPSSGLPISKTSPLKSGGTSTTAAPSQSFGMSVSNPPRSSPSSTSSPRPPNPPRSGGGRGAGSGIGGGRRWQPGKAHTGPPKSREEIMAQLLEAQKEANKRAGKLGPKPTKYSEKLYPGINNEINYKDDAQTEEWPIYPAVIDLMSEPPPAVNQYDWTYLIDLNKDEYGNVIIEKQTGVWIVRHPYSLPLALRKGAPVLLCLVTSLVWSSWPPKPGVFKPNTTKAETQKEKKGGKRKKEQEKEGKSKKKKKQKGEKENQTAETGKGKKGGKKGGKKARKGSDDDDDDDDDSGSDDEEKKDMWKCQLVVNLGGVAKGQEKAAIWQTDVTGTEHPSFKPLLLLQDDIKDLFKASGVLISGKEPALGAFVRHGCRHDQAADKERMHPPQTTIKFPFKGPKKGEYVDPETLLPFRNTCKFGYTIPPVKRGDPDQIVWCDVNDPTKIWPFTNEENFRHARYQIQWKIPGIVINAKNSSAWPHQEAEELIIQTGISDWIPPDYVKQLLAKQEKEKEKEEPKEEEKEEKVKTESHQPPGQQDLGGEGGDGGENVNGEYQGGMEVDNPEDSHSKLTERKRENREIVGADLSEEPKDYSLLG